MSNTEGSPNVPKLPDLKLGENSVSHALSSMKVDQSDIKIGKLTLDSVVHNDQRQHSPRSPRRLQQITELKDEPEIEMKPRFRRISARENRSETSSPTHITSTTSTVTNTSTVERSISVSLSSDSILRRHVNISNSFLESSSLAITGANKTYEDSYKSLEESMNQYSNMLKQVEEIKTLQNERNQQILDKNQNLVDIVNRRRQNIQRIYHQNYLRKKAFLRKKYNNEIKYLYQKRQRDIEILQLERKRLRQKKLLQLKKHKQEKLRKARLLQIKQREAQIEQAQAYYMRKREIQKKKLLSLSLNSKVTNYSQTEDPSLFDENDYYSDDYYSDDDQQPIAVHSIFRAS